MELRIGNRDPQTGLYEVIYPDGSSTLNGMKIFNAAHQVGDVVRATRRSDGIMMLDGVKAFEVPTADKSIGVKEFGKQPNGYLQGQVFNGDDEKKPKSCISVRSRYQATPNSLGEVRNLNPRLYILGSNTSTSSIVATSSYSGLLDTTGKKVLIENNNSTTYLDSYGRQNNYFIRQKQGLTTLGFDSTIDSIVSKKLIRDWALSVGIRYVSIYVYNEIFFDFNSSIPPNADEPNASPTRSFPAYFNSVNIGYGSMDMPAEARSSLSGSISSSDTLSRYPDDSGAKYCGVNLMPIQLNTINFRKQLFQNTPLYIKNFRSTIYQCAIEFDILADPNLLLPAIIPAQADPQIDPAPPPLITTEWRTTFEQFVPYEQLTPF